MTARQGAGPDTFPGLPPGVHPLEAGDPQSVGPYLVLARLGTGGMGVVYLGRSPRSGVVAIKTLHPAYAGAEELRRRFRAEVGHASRVPPIWTARVIEDGTDHDRPFIVTEYIEGPPLSRVVEARGALPPPTLLAVAIGVAGALKAIHGAGLVHRDLKPANVLLARTGPRVIDFGIARDVDVAGGPTQAGVVMGSPGWIAPERLMGWGATAASDVFSWGCLIAYAATGRHPFGEGDVVELTHRTIGAEPDLAGVADSLRAIIAEALGKDPTTRPTAEELLSALVGEAPAVEAVARIWRPPVVGVPPQGGAPGRDLALPARRDAPVGGVHGRPHPAGAAFDPVLDPLIDPAVDAADGPAPGRMMDFGLPADPADPAGYRSHTGPRPRAGVGRRPRLRTGIAAAWASAAAAVAIVAANGLDLHSETPRPDRGAVSPSASRKGTAIRVPGGAAVITQATTPASNASSTEAAPSPQGSDTAAPAPSAPVSTLPSGGQVPGVVPTTATPTPTPSPSHKGRDSTRKPKPTHAP